MSVELSSFLTTQKWHWSVTVFSKDRACCTLVLTYMHTVHLQKQTPGSCLTLNEEILQTASANSVYATRIHECGPSRLWGSDLENVLLTKPCISADSEFCFTNIHIQVKKT